MLSQSLGFHTNLATALHKDGGAQLVNVEMPQKPFAVLMDMAPVHTSAETMNMLEEDFPWIGIIMIHPHCTSFLRPCDVGLMTPFKRAVRRTARERCAKANYIDSTTTLMLLRPHPCLT
eukprot:2229707-Amphidinium_carterae.1